MEKCVAIIHVPVNRNDSSKQSPSLVAYVQITLARQWGGWHMASVIGGWVNSEGKTIVEPMLEFRVAMEDSDENRGVFRDIASVVAFAGQQELVYIVHARGDVELVPP